MLGLIERLLRDFTPIIECEIFNYEALQKGELISVKGRGLIDTGATDVSIREAHRAELKLASTEMAVENGCVGMLQVSMPYRTTVVLAGSDIADPSNSYFKGFGHARTFVTTFSNTFDFIIGMNVLSLVDMKFIPNGTFEIFLP